jgi:hypothetical protein
MWNGPLKTGVSLANAHALTNLTSAAETTSLWRYVSICLRSESLGNVTTENILSSLPTRHHIVSDSIHCIFSKCCLVTIKAINLIILLAAIPHFMKKYIRMFVCLSPLVAFEQSNAIHLAVRELATLRRRDGYEMIATSLLYLHSKCELASRGLCRSALSNAWYIFLAPSVSTYNWADF